MSRYDNCSREELLRRIEELEAQLDTPKGSGSRFRERYACKILDSIPDMLTVLDRDGTLVELVSADETNHVGVPGGELAGQNIRTMPPAACRNVKNNLDNVFATGCGSSSHHDITLDGRTRNYENRIFPLDGEHALCICRDITEAEAAKHELEMVKYALNNVDEEIYACSLTVRWNMPTSSSGCGTMSKATFRNQGLRFLVVRRFPFAVGSPAGENTPR